MLRIMLFAVVGGALAGSALAQSQTYEQRQAAFCRAPELVPSNGPLASRAASANAKTLAAKAAIADAFSGAYDPQKRREALRLRDQAALAWLSVDLGCAIEPRRTKLDALRQEAAEARLAAMRAYEDYAHLSGGQGRDAAYERLKQAQERMWDAREAQDAAEREYRSLRAAQRGITGFPVYADPDRGRRLMQRTQLMTVIDELKALRALPTSDSAEVERLTKRMDELRKASLSPPAASATASVTSELAQLPAYPPGSDHQPSRPAVLPVLPPG